MMRKKQIWFLVGMAMVAAAPTAVAAEPPRVAEIVDGIDRTVSYDVASVKARLDRRLARLTIAVTLHTPFPTETAEGWWAGVSVGVGYRPSYGDDCRSSADGVGRTSLIISAKRERGTPEKPEIHSAQVRVAYRDAGVEIPVAFTADRRTATVTIEDNLLRRADLRCLSARGTGRGPRDASLPQGGPTSDEVKAAYFRGYSPVALLKKALKRCDARWRGKPWSRRRVACRTRARARRY